MLAVIHIPSVFDFRQSRVTGRILGELVFAVSTIYEIKGRRRECAVGINCVVNTAVAPEIGPQFTRIPLDELCSAGKPIEIVVSRIYGYPLFCES